MRTVKTLDTWDGVEKGLRFRIVQITETRVEISHPDIETRWTRIHEESERQILAERIKNGE